MQVQWPFDGVATGNNYNPPPDGGFGALRSLSSFTSSSESVHCHLLLFFFCRKGFFSDKARWNGRLRYDGWIEVNNMNLCQSWNYIMFSLGHRNDTLTFPSDSIQLVFDYPVQIHSNTSTMIPTDIWRLWASCFSIQLQPLQFEMAFSWHSFGVDDWKRCIPHDLMPRPDDEATDWCCWKSLIMFIWYVLEANNFRKKTSFFVFLPNQPSLVRMASTFLWKIVILLFLWFWRINCFLFHVWRISLSRCPNCFSPNSKF